MVTVRIWLRYKGEGDIIFLVYILPWVTVIVMVGLPPMFQCYGSC